MDEDDFKDRAKSNRPKKTQFRELTKSSWELSLQKSVLYRVLREPDDFFLKSSIVQDLQIDSISAGRALAHLVENGFLTYKKVDPKIYPSFETSVSVISWFKDKWVFGKIPTLNNFRNRRNFRTKKQIEEYIRKNPPKSVEWDGKAYFIIRDSKFIKACKQANVPSDPTADWSCPICGREKISYLAHECNNGSCDYRRWPYEWPVPAKMKECKRCGIKFPVGDKSHTITNCNMYVINEVMGK